MCALLQLRTLALGSSNGKHTVFILHGCCLSLVNNVAMPWHQPSLGRTTRIFILPDCCFSRVKHCCLALALARFRKDNSHFYFAVLAVLSSVAFPWHQPCSGRTAHIFILCDWCCSHVRQCCRALASAKFQKDSTLFVVVAVLAIRGCTSGGVHVPCCIYMHAR